MAIMLGTMRHAANREKGALRTYATPRSQYPQCRSMRLVSFASCGNWAVTAAKARKATNARSGDVQSRPYGHGTQAANMVTSARLPSIHP